MVRLALKIAANKFLHANDFQITPVRDSGVIALLWVYTIYSNSQDLKLITGYSPERIYHRMIQRPVPSVAAIIIENNQILLVRRGSEPSKGRWSIPGGRVEWGESLVDAVKREVNEETGLLIEPGNIAGVYDLIIPDGDEIRYHYVIIDYYAKQVGGKLAANDDAAEVRWVPISQLESYNLAEHLRDRLKEMSLIS